VQVGKDEPPVTSVPGHQGDSPSRDAHPDQETRRHLHDTVVQSLELIAGGAAGSPATLADAQSLARRAADDLRRWLEGEPRERAGSLGEAVRSVATAAQEFAPYPIEVVVGQDDGAVPLGIAAVLSAAAGEALTNARKHSGASRVVVFCEDVAGRALVTVRDDGKGADPKVIRSGRGVDESVVRRIEEIGGTVEISSGGSGTAISMRVPAGTPS
jgi:signal transduction histidine kinase